MKAGKLGVYQRMIGEKSPLHSQRVNEFYKKGCQEKNSASTGGREDFCLEIQPTAVRQLMRASGASQHSVERFLNGERVHPATRASLEKAIAQLEQQARTIKCD
jgi:hypothetical protein